MLRSIIKFKDYLAGYFNLREHSYGSFYFLIKSLSGDKNLHVDFSYYDDEGNKHTEPTKLVICEHLKEEDDLRIECISEESLSSNLSEELFFYKAITEVKKILKIEDDFQILEFNRLDIIHESTLGELQEKCVRLDLVSIPTINFIE